MLGCNMHILLYICDGVGFRWYALPQGNCRVPKPVWWNGGRSCWPEPRRKRGHKDVLEWGELGRHDHRCVPHILPWWVGLFWIRTFCLGLPPSWRNLWIPPCRTRVRRKSSFDSLKVGSIFLSRPSRGLLLSRSRWQGCSVGHKPICRPWPVGGKGVQKTKEEKGRGCQQDAKTVAQRDISHRGARYCDRRQIQPFLPAETFPIHPSKYHDR